MFKIAAKLFLMPCIQAPMSPLYQCLCFYAGLVASSVSSNRTGLDMASILQNKLGQKDTDELGKTFTSCLKHETMLRL